MATMENERAELPLDVTTVTRDTGTWAKAVDVTVSAKEVTGEFDAVAGEIAGSVNLPGFRKGKVPRDIVYKRFGEDIKKQVTANLLQRGIRSAILKEGLDVVGEPQVDFQKCKAVRGEDFVFELNVEAKPKFELANYKGLSIEQEEVELLPGELEQAIDQIRTRFGVSGEAEKDHAVADRDTTRGNLSFLVDGAIVHKEEGHLLVSDGHVLGAYAHLGAKFLEGAKIGEKRSVEEVLNQTFPVAEHRGKKATIEFEVASITHLKLPEIDDALAKKVGLKNAEDIKDKVRSTLLERIGTEIRDHTRRSLLEKIALATPFELPQRLSDTLSAHGAENSLAELTRMGIQPEAVGLSLETVRANARQSATMEIRNYFILDALCAKEGIVVSDEDIDDEIVKLARRQNMRASDLYDKLIEEDGLRQLEVGLKSTKALDFIVENAEIKIIPRKPAENPHEHEHHEHSPKETAALSQPG